MTDWRECVSEFIWHFVTFLLHHTFLDTYNKVVDVLSMWRTYNAYDKMFSNFRFQIFAREGFVKAFPVGQDMLGPLF